MLKVQVEITQDDINLARRSEQPYPENFAIARALNIKVQNVSADRIEVLIIKELSRRNIRFYLRTPPVLATFIIHFGMSYSVQPISFILEIPNATAATFPGCNQVKDK